MAPPSEPETDTTLLLTSPTLWHLITITPDLRTKVNRICLLTESITNPTSPFAYTSHSLSLDSGVGPPLLATPTPAFSSAKTRHIVKRLLTNTPQHPQSDLDQDQDAWRTRGVYSIGERLASVEEHAVLSTAGGLVAGRNGGDGDFGRDLKWVDIRCFLEEGRVLLRYCRPDVSGSGAGGGCGDEGQGLLWVQEWIEF